MKHVGTEMALHVLACNIKRVMQIVGNGGLGSGPNEAQASEKSSGRLCRSGRSFVAERMFEWGYATGCE